MALIGQAVSEEKIFEIVDRRRTSYKLTLGSGELKSTSDGQILSCLEHTRTLALKKKCESPSFTCQFCSRLLRTAFNASATFRRKLHLSKMSPCPDPYPNPSGWWLKMWTYRLVFYGINLKILAVNIFEVTFSTKHIFDEMSYFQHHRYRSPLFGFTSFYCK